MFSVDFTCPKISGVLQRKESNRAKITGIVQLLFLSLAHVCQSRHNDVISHVGSIFSANKFVAPVTFGGINNLNVSGGEKGQNKLYLIIIIMGIFFWNVSGGEKGQNKLYFPLWSC